MTLFICTVGTSLMGGRFDKANYQSMTAQIDAKVARDRATNPDLDAFLIRASAETNGLVRARACPADEVALLVSDTDEGSACGERLRTLVASEIGCTVQVGCIRGLQVNDGKRFQTEAIDSLFQALDNLTRDRLPDEVRLNATGGFKGTLPYLMLYGMFHGYPVDYVYEFSNSLITLPPLPVAFDWPRLSAAAAVLFAISAEGPLPETQWRAMLPKDYWADQRNYDLLFQFEDGLVSLSGPGYLLKRQIDEIQTVSRVLLSPDAMKALDDSRDQTRAAFQTMVMRVRNPLARRTYKHAATLRTSDLVVWKTSHAAAPRMAYWVDGHDVYVGELFPTHDDYDHFWKREPKSRADYDKTAFQAREQEQAVPYAELWEAALASESDDRQQFLDLKDELRQARIELDSSRTIAKARAREARERAREEGRIALERSQLAANTRLKQARKAVAAAERRLTEERRKVSALEAQFASMSILSGETAGTDGGTGAATDESLLQRIAELELHVSLLEAGLDRPESDG